MIELSRKTLEWIRDNVKLSDDPVELNRFFHACKNPYQIKDYVIFFAHYCDIFLGDALDDDILERTFALCSNADITEAVIPGSLTHTGVKMFEWCKKLNTVELEYGVMQIDNESFANSAVSKVILPKTLLEIGSLAFSRCQNLTKINIPEGVTTILSEAFKSCYNLVDITIPNSLKALGTGAFSFTGVKEITIPKTLEMVGQKAFYGCNDLTKVTIEDGVKNIADLAFFNSGVKVLEIPQSVEVIGKHIIGEWKESGGRFSLSANKEHKFKIRGLSREEAKKFALHIKFTNSNERDFFTRKLI